MDSVNLRRSTCTPDIFPCTLQKVKIMKVPTIERQKNSNRNIKNRDAPTLKLATNGLEVFENVPWDYFYAMDFSSNIS